MQEKKRKIGCLVINKGCWAVFCGFFIDRPFYIDIIRAVFCDRLKNLGRRCSRVTCDHIYTGSYSAERDGGITH